MPKVLWLTLLPITLDWKEKLKLNDRGTAGANFNNLVIECTESMSSDT